MGDEKKAFFAHLEELRRRILFSLVSVIFLSALSYIFSEEILGCLARHVKPLIFISPQEAFLSYLKISLFGGLVLSSPVILFNALRFVWVALHGREKGLFAIYFAAALLLFAAGAVFAYYAALPAALRFLLSFSSEFVRPYISISRYISFAVFLILAFAVAFETPLFIVLLTKMGLLNSVILKKKRLYFIVGLFVVAAALTPPDVITQILLAVPLIVLYEISILFARMAEKKAEPR